MLKTLQEFREKLDKVMVQAFGKRIVLWGYGYTGRFLAWYGEYYHSLKPDFIITEDWTVSVPYEFSLFKDTLFEFDYRDVKDAVVWLAIPETSEISEKLMNAGYKKNETYFDFYSIIYGEEYYCLEEKTTDVFHRKKVGVRDIQFMEWLEYKYNCNLVTTVSGRYFKEQKLHNANGYTITTQKEIFPMLDKCHLRLTETDAIFDFGCGKGGAMITFLDYGFKNVGGVEFEERLYNIMIDNFDKLGIEYNNGMGVCCINKDAGEVQEQLDKYNYFYYADPFGENIFKKTIQNICESLKRVPRKAYIISINPRFHQMIKDTGYFELTNQFTVNMRQRVVDVFVTKDIIKN